MLLGASLCSLTIHAPTAFQCGLHHQEQHRTSSVIYTTSLKLCKPRLELDALEEEHLHAAQRLELYRQSMARAYDKLVKWQVFRRGELVLMLRHPIIVAHKTKIKFEPKWEGLYVIEQGYDGGAYQLVDQQGERPMPPINDRFLNKYFA
ncbi:unnamed protein product [Urochloa humidicola]